MTIKTQVTKGKLNKQDYNKFKSFCTAKEIMNRERGKLWDHTPDEGLICKNIRNSYNSIAKIPKQPYYKMCKGPK